MFLSPRVKGSSGLNLGQGYSTTQTIVVISIHTFGHGDQKPQVGLDHGGVWAALLWLVQKNATASWAMKIGSIMLQQLWGRECPVAGTKYKHV